jgi:hypothetical protein
MLVTATTWDPFTDPALIQEQVDYLTYSLTGAMKQ